jgi:hypothetical protein
MVGGAPLIESSPDDLRAEFYWTDENRAASTRDPVALARSWEHEAESIRKRWQSILE